MNVKKTKSSKKIVLKITMSMTLPLYKITAAPTLRALVFPIVWPAANMDHS